MQPGNREDVHHARLAENLLAFAAHAFALAENHGAEKRGALFALAAGMEAARELPPHAIHESRERAHAVLAKLDFRVLPDDGEFSHGQQIPDRPKREPAAALPFLSSSRQFRAFREHGTDFHLQRPEIGIELGQVAFLRRLAAYRIAVRRKNRIHRRTGTPELDIVQNGAPPIQRDRRHRHAEKQDREERPDAHAQPVAEQERLQGKEQRDRPKRAQRLEAQRDISAHGVSAAGT